MPGRASRKRHPPPQNGSATPFPAGLDNAAATAPQRLRQGRHGAFGGGATRVQKSIIIDYDK